MCRKGRERAGKNKKGDQSLQALAYLANAVRPFGAWFADRDNVGLLEGVGAEGAGCDLAAQDHQRHSVAEGVMEAGDGVGRTRARGDNHNT